MCESTNRYTVNTGNGYYGAYQFDLPTWRGLGYTGLPSDAPPAVQDEAALKLYEQRGWQPWPACSRKLGLVSEDRATRSAPREPLTVPATAAPPSTAAVPSSSTTWAGPMMRTADVRQVRSDVAAWQTRMNELGYSLVVDGRYGPASAAACTQFEIDRGLQVERPGIVGPQVWKAAFGA